MQEMKPASSVAPLKKSLDNGGRFYNLLSKADDETITRGELAKAAGVFTAGIQAFLYLQMMKQDLDEAQQQAVVSMLDTKLQRDFAKKQPPFVIPSEVDANNKAGQSVIVTGFARDLGQETLFSGFMIVPIMIGKVMIPMPIAVQSLYRVVELFDNEKMKKPAAIVGLPLKSKLELEGAIQFGGVLKELKSQTKDPPTHPVFLEAIYCVKR